MKVYKHKQGKKTMWNEDAEGATKSADLHNIRKLNQDPKEELLSDILQIVLDHPNYDLPVSLIDRLKNI